MGDHRVTSPFSPGDNSLRCASSARVEALGTVTQAQQHPSRRGPHCVPEGWAGPHGAYTHLYMNTYMSDRGQ